MSLESATFISQLVSANPLSSDQKKQGDDHLRLIKGVLQATFPNADRAFYIPDTVAKNGNYSIVASDNNKTILCDTGSAFTLTLPALTAADDAWSIGIVKVTTDANPVWVLPSAGVINGFSKIRRSVEFVGTRVFWTGSTWVATRTPGVPIGSMVEFYGGVLPNGYLWPDGGTFVAADYVELNTALGGNNKPDRRGRAAFGRDTMGLGAAGRLTTVLGGVDGAALGATGGLQNHTNTIGEMVAHNHGGFTGDPTTAPTIGQQGSTNALAGSDKKEASNTTLPAHVHTISSQGSTTPYSIMNPTIVANFILVAE